MFFSLVIIAISIFFCIQIFSCRVTKEEIENSEIIPLPLENYKKRISNDTQEDSASNIHFLFDKYLKLEEVKTSYEFSCDASESELIKITEWKTDFISSEKKHPNFFDAWIEIKIIHNNLFEPFDLKIKVWHEKKPEIVREMKIRVCSKTFSLTKFKDFSKTSSIFLGSYVFEKDLSINLIKIIEQFYNWLFTINTADNEYSYFLSHVQSKDFNFQTIHENFNEGSGTIGSLNNDYFRDVCYVEWKYTHVEILSHE